MSVALWNSSYGLSMVEMAYDSELLICGSDLVSDQELLAGLEKQLYPLRNMNN